MSSGPLEWCIEIAIIAAICAGIFVGAHTRITASDQGSRHTPADRAACFQRSASDTGMRAIPRGRHIA
ncbi:hypothetical protein GWG65_27520 [Bradyrhizobium sp. CSA207]|nr:hypothetical protein [Bradyrhizobium sp. CSA207]